jgi:hypothetical protein
MKKGKSFALILFLFSDRYQAMLEIKKNQLRIRGKGNQGKYGGLSGDLLIQIEFENDYEKQNKFEITIVNQLLKNIKLKRLVNYFCTQK